MEQRQVPNLIRPTTTTASRHHCTAFTLPSNGILDLGISSILTLTSDAVFKPQCTGSSSAVLAQAGNPTFIDLRDPFYASTIPECYALAATTVIAYMLVIMLFITPRTFLHEGAVVLGRRGFTNGPSGSDAGIGIGGRPWLQKLATMTVAVSLTIATSDTFKIAELQYLNGYMDARLLQDQVEGGTELKVIRVISDTFLWLAQAQTLIRLFPRQREKIIIKWTAFALITLDELFTILNNWVYSGTTKPRNFSDAVPALAYLFQLALSLLYAAWVLYYAITKKKCAFYHPQMRNICLVALLSLVAVLVPVVFFVLDISKPDVAGWGDYVRWVGAAAASVVVWEWVERIEALERNDKKDGILGREVFDGDEMLEVTTSPDAKATNRSSRKNGGKGKGGSGSAATTGSGGVLWPGVAGITNRYRPRGNQDVEAGPAAARGITRNVSRRIHRARPPLWPTRPPAVATPVSRTETASAESTVYAVRYHPISEATPPIVVTAEAPGPSRNNSLELTPARSIPEDTSSNLDKSVSVEQMEEGYESQPQQERTNAWQMISKANPFKRKVQEPPPEVSAHSAKSPEPVSAHDSSHKWDVRGRLEEFAVSRVEKFREKREEISKVAPLPVTVIPAPPRRRNLAAALEELDGEESQDRAATPWLTPPTPASTTSPTNPDGVESSRQSSQRLSDPYVPDHLNGHSVHQRGAISFATTTQHSRAGSRTLSPIEIPRGSTPLSPRSSPAPPRPSSSIHPDGLPVVNIPAPPRRPRSEEE